MSELCPSCQKRPKKRHFNAKWCSPCAAKRRKKPLTNLTAAQKRFVLEKKGTLSGREMAKELGTSWSNVMRFARDQKISLATFHGSCKHKMNPTLIRQVCAYYERHGMIETQKRFPNIKCRSIIERYPHFKPRQKRWTDQQLIEAAKMAGVVSKKNQARFFNRPNANEGSIQALWTKRLKNSGGGIHGMSEYLGRELVTKRCPYLQTSVWQVRQVRKSKSISYTRKLYLWVDMEKHLRRGCPKFIVTAIQTMAEFQRWLFQSDNPKPKILRMIKTRDEYTIGNNT